MEILKKKMEGLSKGMMERMEEYLQSVHLYDYSNKSSTGRKQRIEAEMNKASKFQKINK